MEKNVVCENKQTVRPQHRVRESIGWCGLCCNYKDLEDRQDESRKKEGTATSGGNPWT